MQYLLKVAGLQADLVWEQQEQNLTQFEAQIDALSNDIDLIVLPEMFSTGFTMSPKNVAETKDGDSVAWMKNIASKKDCAIMGSLVIIEDKNYYNRVIFAHPNGKIKTYDKRHSFTLSGEHLQYKCGTEKVIIEYRGWKICPQICYDLRFPVWSRNAEDYDLLVYMANWPKPRIAAWDTLLKARAIENMSYCVGVNRVGNDQNGYEFIGHTSAFDYLGNEVAATQENQVDFFETTFSKLEM